MVPRGSSAGQAVHRIHTIAPEPGCLERGDPYKVERAVNCTNTSGFRRWRGLQIVVQKSTGSGQRVTEEACVGESQKAWDVGGIRPARGGVGARCGGLRRRRRGELGRRRHDRGVERRRQHRGASVVVVHGDRVRGRRRSGCADRVRLPAPGLVAHPDDPDRRGDPVPAREAELEGGRPQRRLSVLRRRDRPGRQVGLGQVLDERPGLRGEREARRGASAPSTRAALRSSSRS